MRRLLVIFTLTATALLLLSSCAEELFLEITSSDIENFEGEPSIMVPQEGGVFELAVRCSGEISVSTIGNSINWLSHKISTNSTGDQIVIVTIAENTQTEERRGTLVVNGADMSYTVVFYQKPKASLTLSSSQVVIPTDGGEFVVETFANYDVVHTISEDWIKLVGTSKDYDRTCYTFRVEPYYEYNKRTGSVVFTCGDVTETVTIYQTFEEDFVLFSNSYWVSDERQTFSIDLRSNIDFTVEVPEADWLKSITTKASSTHTCMFEVAENESFEQRTADIIFRSDIGTTSTVTVTQQYKEGFVLGETEYYADGKGETFDIRINTSVDIDYYAWAEWMTVSYDKDKKVLHIIVEPNDSKEIRSDYIYVYGKGINEPQILTIYQQSENSVYLAKETGLAYCNAGTHTVHFIRNVNFSCTVSEDAASWISIPDGQANGISDSMTLAVAEYEGEEERSGTVTFNYSDGKSDVYTLTQVPPGNIVFAYNRYKYSHADYMHNCSIEVISDVEVVLEIPEDAKHWLTTDSPYGTMMSASTAVSRYYNLYILPVEDKEKTLRATVRAWTIDHKDYQDINIIVEPAVPTGDAASVQEIRDALMAFYEATGGDNWVNNDGWGTDKPFNEWHGVTCTVYEGGSFDEVEKIHDMTLQFSENNLTGTVPSDIYDIPVLSYISFWNENIEGLEDGISNLECLETLSIIGCSDLSRVPKDMFESPSLNKIIIDGSPKLNMLPDLNKENKILKELRVTGSGNGNEDTNLLVFPEAIFDMTGLQSLELIYHSFMSPVELSENIGNLTNLNKLNIDGCNLTGNIPESIGNLSKLTELKLSYNQFTGELPATITRLKDLQTLDLSNNNLSGEIPEDISNLTDLKKLYLSYNDFCGEIPEGIATLKNLTSFNCASNRLSIGHVKSDAESYLSTTMYQSMQNSNDWRLYPQRLTPEEDALQRQMLADVYEAFNGDNWKDNTNWLDDNVPVDEWCGVSVETEYEIVTNINLRNNNSEGTYPDSILEWESFVNNIPYPYADLYLSFNISVDKITGELSDRFLHAKFYRDNWPSTFMNNVGEYINTDKLPVGVTVFEFNDIDGQVQSSKELFKKHKHVLFCMLNDPAWLRLQIENLAVLQGIKQSLGDDIAIICAYDDEEYLKELQKRFEDFTFVQTKEIQDKVGAVHYAWDYCTAAALNSYFEKSVINANVQEAQSIDFLVLIDCERSVNIWQGSSWDGITPGDEGASLKRYGVKSLVSYLEDIYGVTVSDEYSSTDMSHEGKVSTLQTATHGEGINMVIIGDGFTDKHHASGLYQEAMEVAYESFFMVEPFRSHMDRFNVYTVSTVSPSIVNNTSLNTGYGSGTHIDGNENKVFEYALMAPTVTEDNINNTICLVIVNNPRTSGTCWWFEDNSFVAYATMSQYKVNDYESTICHEAGGHGFGKLGDEYWYNDDRKAPSNAMKLEKSFGWLENLDTTDDPEYILWSEFLDMDEYKSTTGIFEGGYEYGKGIYRPSEQSIMRYNSSIGPGSVFNAPSRLAIYKRIMEFSGEDYSFEKFLEYDKINLIPTQGPSKSQGIKERKHIEKETMHIGPVIAGKSWRDAE